MKSLFLLAGLVFVLLQPTHGLDMMRKRKNCWPDNSTMTQCFSSLPDHKMPRPRPPNDTYTTDREDGVDFADFSVKTVQRDPGNFCTYKDKLVGALGCMTSSMTSQCPDMPEEMRTHDDRLKMAFNGYCKKQADVDKICMKTHWMVTMTCKKRVMEDMRKSLPGTGSGGDGPVSRPPPTPPTHEATAQPLTDPKPEGEAKSEAEPKPEPDSFGGDVRRKMACHFQFKMMRCVKQQMQDCHGKTAEVMGQFMKNMATAPCSAMMDTWAAQLTGDNCQDSGCNGSTSGVTFSFALLFFSAIRCFL